MAKMQQEMSGGIQQMLEQQASLRSEIMALQGMLGPDPADSKPAP